MSTYLLPLCDIEGPWIESVIAKGIVEAENKFVKSLADDYEFIDYGDNFNSMKEAMKENNILVGDVYDKEEF